MFKCSPAALTYIDQYFTLKNEDVMKMTGSLIIDISFCRPSSNLSQQSSWCSWAWLGERLCGGIVGHPHGAQTHCGRIERWASFQEEVGQKLSFLVEVVVVLFLWEKAVVLCLME